MYGMAVSLASYLALLLYTTAFGPGAIGAALDFRRASVGRVAEPSPATGSEAVDEPGPTIVAIEPGGPAERAGLQVGDRIVRALDQRVTTLFDWAAVALQMEVTRPFPLVIERQGRQHEAALSFRPYWQTWQGDTWLLFALKCAAHLLVFSLALFLALARCNDPLARLGALFLGGMAVANLVPLSALDPRTPALPYGAHAFWREAPAPLHAPLWVGQLTFLVSPVLPMLFFVSFPRPLFTTRRAWLWFAVPWALVSVFEVVPLIHWTAREIYDPLHATGVYPSWFTPVVGLSVVVTIACGLVCFVANYRRLTDANERRRVRVLVAGAVIGLAAVLPNGMASFSGSATLETIVRSTAARAVSAMLFLVFPLSFAYAIARHRLFDIRILVRRGLQYALARRLLLSIVPACAVLLAVDLLVHGDQPLRTIVAARGWIYALVAGLALAAHARRTRWLDALDRRFFREHYDAQRLVRRIVDDLRTETTLERAGPRVVSQIEGAVHPEFAALLVRAPGDTFYRPVAAAPPERLPPPIPASSKLVTLVRVLGKPVDVAAGESGWMKEQLPHEETAFLRETRIGLLVPVTTAGEGADALLALGMKRSEEPYSREDQELMATLAGSLALVVARPAAASPREAFAECPQCGTCYDPGTPACTTDGASLAALPFPRLLAQRYRIERRLGRGGMGTVYEGIDTQLDRHVALKLIREEWVGDAQAAERFRREARAAASFSHPNVVTVHDFGVEGENRGFLVMELLRGAALRDVLRRERRLATGRSLALMRDVCAGVEAAHRRSLAHRDLKPENVFLVSDGGEGERAKILDFGIAKVLAPGAQAATVTATGGVLGTLHYMGPEQLRGAEAAPGWDLWALAVMAYEMLAGALPFDCTSAADYQSSVLAGRPTPIRVHVTGAPEALEAFFARSLGADAEQRPARAAVLLAELERALAVD
jgi:hypothetical protein